MKKGIIVWIAAIIIVAAVAYYYTEFKFTGTVTTIFTSTIPKQVTNTTTIAATTSLAPYVPPNCSSFQLSSSLPYAIVNGNCTSSGETLGLWVKAGESGTGSISITSANNVSYLNTTFNYNCTTFYKSLYLPAQLYNIQFNTGPGGGSCGGVSLVKLNSTTAPPRQVYNYIYNSNFSNGLYTGWNESGQGFGPVPLNITYASANGCYLSAPWSNYIGTYVATTFNCGLSVAPGNLTSFPFRVDPNTPFLNFRIVSPGDNFLYVEIIEFPSGNLNPANGTVKIIDHFDTYNVSLQNAASTFVNASIPLTTVTNKVIEIRLVADTLERQRFIAVGDLGLSALPNQQPGLSTQLQIMNIT